MLATSTYLITTPLDRETISPRDPPRVAEPSHPVASLLYIHFTHLAEAIGLLVRTDPEPVVEIGLGVVQYSLEDVGVPLGRSLLPIEVAFHSSAE